MPPSLPCNLLVGLLLCSNMSVSGFHLELALFLFPKDWRMPLVSPLSPVWLPPGWPSCRWKPRVCRMPLITSLMKSGTTAGMGRKKEGVLIKKGGGQTYYNAKPHCSDSRPADSHFQDYFYLYLLTSQSQVTK